jgi:hypothetical protein
VFATALYALVFRVLVDEGRVPLLVSQIVLTSSSATGAASKPT